MRLWHLKHLCTLALLISPLMAEDGGQGEGGGRYVQTNLISDVPGTAIHTDANLINAWGIAFGGTGPWWVNTGGTALSLVYDGTGAAFPASGQLKVAIPPAGMSEPTGIVFNGTTDFQLSGGQAAAFLFANSNGTISGWNPKVDATNAVIKITTADADYKGLTLGQMAGKNVLYAANFARGIDVFDANFGPVTLTAGAFEDPSLPTGFHPFNVQNIVGSIFVMFSQRGADGDEVKQPGLGFVDEFTADGKLVMRLHHGKWMNAPWGIVSAPPGFGRASGLLLVGQFGSGNIVAFNPKNGHFEGRLRGTNGKRLQIDGLWGIRFGNDATAGSSHELFFAAGIQDESHGLFGKLSLAPDNDKDDLDQSDDDGN